MSEESKKVSEIPAFEKNEMNDESLEFLSGGVRPPVLRPKRREAPDASTKCSSFAPAFPGHFAAGCLDCLYYCARRGPEQCVYLLE